MRDVVLVHVIPQLLKFDDLVALPSDELVPTLLDGASLRPSLAGATSGSNAGETGSGSIGLIDADQPACAPNSTLHTIKGLLLPDDFELPETAQPRDLNAEDGVEDGVEDRRVPSGDGEGDDDSGGSLGTGAIAGIAAAAVAALLLLITLAVIMIAGKRRKDQKAEEDLKAVAAKGAKAGFPPGHPMYNQAASEFGSVPSTAAPPYGIPSGFESQWGPPPPNGSFVSSGSGPPPYPMGHPGAAGAPYGTPQHGPSQVSTMGYGTANNTHSSAGSDRARNHLGVQSFGTDTYHERNQMRDSPNVTNGSNASGRGLGSAVGASSNILCEQHVCSNLGASYLACMYPMLFPVHHIQLLVMVTIVCCDQDNASR